MEKELSEMTIEELWQLFPVILTAHNEEWEEWYQEEYTNLTALLKEIDVIRISHIGSTSIKGIWAKPIVDVLIELKDKSNLKDTNQLLINDGYLCMSATDDRIDLNKGYTNHGFARRVFHIHLRLQGDNDELYFRDFMNEHPAAAHEYEQLKLSLWKEYEHDRDGYTKAKTEFIIKYTKQAKKAYGDRYSGSRD